MEDTHYKELLDGPVRTAADLVNTVGSTTGNEYLATRDDAVRFLASRGFEPGSLSERDLEELREVRERLRPVFFASNEQAAVAALNALLADLDPLPQLVAHDGDWHLHLVAGEAPVARRFGAAVAMGLAQAIAANGFDRIGVCAADDCNDVFVDVSRNRSKRFCGESCSTRSHVAAYRARRRAERA